MRSRNDLTRWPIELVAAFSEAVVLLTVAILTALSFTTFFVRPFVSLPKLTKICKKFFLLSCFAPGAALALTPLHESKFNR